MISLTLLFAFSCGPDQESNATPKGEQAELVLPVPEVPDDNLLADAPLPVERLVLSEAVWGVAVPNAVKALPIIYDA